MNDELVGLKIVRIITSCGTPDIQFHTHVLPVVLSTIVNALIRSISTNCDGSDGLVIFTISVVRLCCCHVPFGGGGLVVLNPVPPVLFCGCGWVRFSTIFFNAAMAASALARSVAWGIDGCVFAGRCPRASDTCRAYAPALERKTGAAHVAACHYPVERWPIDEDELRRYAGAVESG